MNACATSLQKEFHTNLTDYEIIAKMFEIIIYNLKIFESTQINSITTPQLLHLALITQKYLCLRGTLL